MSSLQDIAVPGITVPPSDGLSGNVLALLHEIASLLTALAEEGAPGSIDLRGLPLLPGEREVLKTVLGDGEVVAVIDALGETRVTETRLAGVWWVRHADPAGETIAEFIEVTPCPAILKSDPRDMREAGVALREQLAEWTGGATGGDDGR